MYGVCVFELRSSRDGATHHFNIPNNVGETGHLFENPTSNETACQQRVMHIFPLVFPAKKNRRAFGESWWAEGETLLIKTRRMQGTKQTRYTSKPVRTELKQLQRKPANWLCYQGLSFCSCPVAVQEEGLGGGVVVFLRGHLEEIKVQPDTAAPWNMTQGWMEAFRPVSVFPHVVLLFFICPSPNKTRTALSDTLTPAEQTRFCQSHRYSPFFKMCFFFFIM